ADVDVVPVVIGERLGIGAVKYFEQLANEDRVRSESMPVGYAADHARLGGRQYRDAMCFQPLARLESLFPQTAAHEGFRDIAIAQPQHVDAEGLGGVHRLMKRSLPVDADQQRWRMKAQRTDGCR